MPKTHKDTQCVGVLTIFLVHRAHMRDGTFSQVLTWAVELQQCSSRYVLAGALRAGVPRAKERVFGPNLSLHFAALILPSIPSREVSPTQQKLVWEKHKYRDGHRQPRTESSAGHHTHTCMFRQSWHVRSITLKSSAGLTKRQNNPTHSTKRGALPPASRRTNGVCT